MMDSLNDEGVNIGQYIFGGLVYQKEDKKKVEKNRNLKRHNRSIINKDKDKDKDNDNEDDLNLAMGSNASPKNINAMREHVVKFLKDYDSRNVENLEPTNDL